MDDVAAVAAGVAAGELDGGGEEVLRGLCCWMTRAPWRNSAKMAVMTKAAREKVIQRVEGALVIGGENGPGMDAEGDDGDGHDESDDAGQNEVFADAAHGGAAPGEQRADAGEQEQEDSDGDGDAVIEGRADGDAIALNVFGEDREERAPEDGEAGGEQDQVVEEEAGLAGDEGLELVLGPEVVAVVDEGEEADGEDDDQEDPEPGADGGLGKGVDGADQSGAGEQGAEDGEHEGGEDEPDVPALHHAALLLHHDGVQEGGAGEPGHEGGVFDGIPAPVAAPAEDLVGPVHAEEDAAR